MLERLRSRLEAGDREGALAALREALSQLCVARFVSGWTRHPLLDPRSKEFVGAVRGFARALMEDPVMAEEVVEALEAPDEERVNLAFERLLPDFALLLDEALTDAKHELGSKASNVESVSDHLWAHPFVAVEAALAAELTEGAFKAGASARLRALEKVRLDDLDSPETDVLPLQDLLDDSLVFTCPKCGLLQSQPFAAAGRPYVCLSCGRPLTVPRARLGRMAAYLKRKRDALRGISRCRVCKGYIQTGRRGFMRAGYCGAYCAHRGRELFREYVAREGAWENDRILFACECGRTHRAAESEIGTKRACESCGIDVWIPHADGLQRRGDVVSCVHCGRPMKKTAVACMYCGQARTS